MKWMTLLLLLGGQAMAADAPFRPTYTVPDMRDGQGFDWKKPHEKEFDRLVRIWRENKLNPSPEALNCIYARFGFVLTDRLCKSSSPHPALLSARAAFEALVLLHCMDDDGDENKEANDILKWSAANPKKVVPTGGAIPPIQRAEAEAELRKLAESWEGGTDKLDGRIAALVLMGVAWSLPAALPARLTLLRAAGVTP